MSTDFPDAASRKRGRALLIAGISGTVILLVLVGLGVYGLIARPHENTPTPAPTTSEQRPTAPAPSGPPELTPLPRTNDPIRYARAVAEALFTWDTASGLRPADYGQVVLSDADPTGTETPGLASDIAGYYPAPDAWRQLTGHATTQHLTTETAVIPDAWADAIAQDRSGTLVEGMIAVTIDGTRHRTGTVSGQEATSEHPVSFTVFLACEPAFESCHTLRLSELDNPLR
ncbi:hypothetical protein GCM10025768_13770 [Microbacterium pseudoresistens]|uniref:Uncharacterized protein n=1 Tax=Microbacterium pseudoresistens TaxID=640634 RepID=A0A7Y9ET43_9MICO|nr:MULTISPECIES: hypothetical protein [Microbacterium]MBY6062607.1 hypothetical protein [Microbacterium esteraromaticum]NYD53269.1 hypothetical protein [Microbacterium pseudoresistens]